MSEYLLGVNVGNSIIRAGIYTLDGEEVGTQWTEVEINSPRPGYFQVDLENIFEDTVTVIRKLIIHHAIDAAKIKAMSFTGNTNGLYLIDNEGKPVCEGILGFDKRAKSIVDIWNDNGLREKLNSVTKQDPLAGHTASICRWFARNKPDILEKTSYILFIKDYIRYKFCGKINIEETEISVSGLYDFQQKQISSQVLEDIGFSAYGHLFAETVRHTDICGGVLAEVAEKTGLKAGTVVVAGVNGIVAGAIASGVTGEFQDQQRYLTVCIGLMISIHYLVTSVEEVIMNKLKSLYVEGGVFLAVKLSKTSCANLRWFIDDFLKGEKEEAEKSGKCIFQICDEAVLNTSPKDSSVIFLPYIYTADLSTDIGGALLNISMNDSREHIIRAIYEGVIFDIKHSMEYVPEEIFSGKVIRALGGEWDTVVWWQMLANALGCTVEVVDSASPRALGAAVCAGVGINAFASFEEGSRKMFHVKSRYEPDLELKPWYDEKYELYQYYVENLISNS